MTLDIQISRWKLYVSDAEAAELRAEATRRRLHLSELVRLALIEGRRRKLDKRQLTFTDARQIEPDAVTRRRRIEVRMVESLRRKVVSWGQCSARDTVLSYARE